MDAPMERLWQKTPLIRSSAMSAKTGCEVYLKIETFQTSGSFKGRGVSHFANNATKGYLESRGLLDTDTYVNGNSNSNSLLDTKELASRISSTDWNEWSIPCKTSHIPANKRPHLIIASGGNAGLSAASAARILGVNASIFLPAAQEGIKHLFLRHNTGIDGDARIEVNIGGENYFAALKAAEKFSDELGDRGILVPAYAPWVKLFTSCFGATDDPLVWQGHSTLIQEISEQLPNGLKPDALLCSVGGAGLIAGLMVGCEVVPTWDQNDHFVVTELACSATLVPAYTPSLLSSILSSTSRHPKAVSVNGHSHTGTNGTANGKEDATPKSKPVVVFIVCGGSKGSVEDLKQFRTLLGEWNDQDDEIWVDGERL
ncbi:hypothetical protein FRC14_005953 [Serendipita sp. 396]|nr:hypothetical protein FRC14_005953 [Serendipita sp. 396]